MDAIAELGVCNLVVSASYQYCFLIEMDVFIAVIVHYYQSFHQAAKGKQDLLLAPWPFFSLPVCKLLLEGQLDRFEVEDDAISLPANLIILFAFYFFYLYEMLSQFFGAQRLSLLHFFHDSEIL